MGRPLEQGQAGQIEKVLLDLAGQGRRALRGEGVPDGEILEEPALDLCYRGQSTTLTVPWRDVATALGEFHRAHEQRYGHRLEGPVELINVRLGLRTARRELALPRARGVRRPQPRSGRIHGISGAVPIYRRPDLPPGMRLQGPALLVDAESTTYLEPGWRARTDDFGHLLLQQS